MFVIQVTPLLRGTQLESLSYFSSIEYPLGSFLQVPIRGKTQTAIVTETRPVSNTKTTLKAATFSLRKLPTQKDPVVLPESIRQTTKELTNLYPVSAGALLFQLLPPDIRNGNHPYPRVTVNKHLHEETAAQLLTAKLDDRFTAYQSLTRSTFARQGSIMIIVPSATEVAAAREILSHGIEDRVIIFSPQQTKRQRTDAYQKLTDETTTKLIICTPSHAYLERPDLAVYIVEQCASNHYVMRQRPYLDHREALKYHARVTGRSLIFGDTVPRTEDEVKRRDDKYLTYDEAVKRLAFPSSLTIINQRDKPRPENPFKLFSDELQLSVRHALEAHGRVFFYAARRGLAPVVACVDCGHIFRCPDSNTPYSLVRTTHDNKEERWFVSSTSGRRTRAADVCTQCGSWRLRERGIGIQQVYDEWLEKYPNTPVTVLDSATATTTTQAEKIAKKFFTERSGILIGTQIALPFLHHKVDVSAIISLDAARSIPTWRADESLFRLLIRLREFTTKEVIVQTRSEPDNLLLYATRGALERFYDDEITLRKMLHYPPYSRFILLTWIGTPASVLELEIPIKTILAEHKVQYYNNPHSSAHKIYRHGLIRVPAENEEFYATILPRLRSLPPYVKIEINPERIV